MDDVRGRANKAAKGARESAHTAAKRGRKAAANAPSASEWADQARESRVAEAAMAGAAAVMPLVSSAVADAMRRKTVRRAMMMTPVVARRSAASRGLMMFGGVFTVAAAGLAAHRAYRMWSKGRRTSAKRDFAYGEDVQRMDDEGPLPGAYDGEPASIGRVASNGGTTKLRG